MLVSQILKSKSDDGVITVPPGTTVGKAAETLSSRRIGALIVSPDGRRVAMKETMQQSHDDSLLSRRKTRKVGRKSGGKW